MSRILLLLVIVLWMCRTQVPSFQRPMGYSQGAGLFVAGLLLVVLFMGLWSRVLARHVRGETLHRSLQRFHKSMFVARLLIPVWFGVAIFALGWGELVSRMLGPIDRWPVDLPGVIVGTMPAFLAWMALWWAQFPADRALREQSTIIALNEGLPVRSPPTFWSYFSANVRLQVLFTVVPVALIILAHDLASLGLWQWGRVDLRSPVPPTSKIMMIELGVQLASIGLVVFFAPEVLRRVLHTQPLPDSPLRRRLEELCRRTGLEYREILLWKTNYYVCNAAVMGLTRRMRYILLSDMLIETMTDRQIQAVFAHEIGHVKHWHMGWYVVLFATLLLACFGPGQLLDEQLNRLPLPAWASMDALKGAVAFMGIAGFFMLFGYVSRSFERQADLFAARTMQALDSPPAPMHTCASLDPYGAAAFIAALHRVAMVNNIPISARNFTHGSIAQRVRYLQSLSSDPAGALRFDRAMSLLNASLLFAMLSCGAWVLVALTVR